MFDVHVGARRLATLTAATATVLALVGASAGAALAAPNTIIDEGPLPVTNNPVQTFFFYSPDDADATFECKADNQPYTPCEVPTETTFTGGTHTFYARAISSVDGSVDPTPAFYNYSVDMVPPETTILSGPSSATNDTTPTFTWRGANSYRYRVDHGPWQVHNEFQNAVTTRTLGPLLDGDHSFEVYAIDQAGNADETPASSSFTVDTVNPATTITSAPAAVSANTTPSFSFASDEAQATFECRIDAAAFAPCVSPAKRTVGGGTHTFAVRALDAAGNVDGTPATSSFRVCSGPLGSVGVLLNGVLPNSGLLCS